MSGEERELLGVNAAFYSAFRAGDLDRIDELWARERDVAVIHPGWPAVHGREAVLDSWRRIVTGGNAPEIVCGEARAYCMGEVAFVICIEHLPGGDLVATNIFVREGGAWRLVHHQAGPTPSAAPPDPSEVVH